MNKTKNHIANEILDEIRSHAGGKLRRSGSSSLSDSELLTIIIGSGCGGRSAEEIAKEIINNYYSLQGLMGKSLNDLMKIKGLKEVKATRIAAVYEIARRIIRALENE